MFRFTITFNASRSGRLSHLIIAKDEDGARARIKSAYPDQEIVFVWVEKRWGKYKG